MINCKFENGYENSLRHVTVDCIVLKNGKILLAKRAITLLEGNKWCLIGGFVERGEDLKQAVKREIEEETGWEVKDIELLRIKDWPSRPNEDRQNISFVSLAMLSEKAGNQTTNLKRLNGSIFPSYQTKKHLPSITMRI